MEKASEWNIYWFCWIWSNIWSDVVPFSSETQDKVEFFMIGGFLSALFLLIKVLFMLPYVSQLFLPSLFLRYQSTLHVFILWKPIVNWMIVCTISRYQSIFSYYKLYSSFNILYNNFQFSVYASRNLIKSNIFFCNL